MNRRPFPSLLPVLLVLGTSGLNLMSGPANAQVGLRYGSLISSTDTSTSAQQKTETPKLKLKLSAVGGTDNNAHVAGPTYALPAYGASEDNSQNNYSNLPASTRNMAMWADWRPFENGVYTSAGWMWRNTLGDANSPINSNDNNNHLSAPFLGLGYQGVIDSGSNWKWSAEVGAYAVGNRNCYNSVLSCSMSSGMGLKPSSNDDGVRWTPYFSLGASYAY